MFYVAKWKQSTGLRNISSYNEYMAGSISIFATSAELTVYTSIKRGRINTAHRSSLVRMLQTIVFSNVFSNG